MGIEVRRVSLWDWLRLQLLVSIPTFIWGLVAPNRWGVACLTRWNWGEHVTRFIGGLRAKYGCAHLWVRFPLAKTLLVLDPASIDEVLHSDANTADPDLKLRAFSRFVPEALIISRRPEWADRRRFNEEALGFGRLHRHAEAFTEIVLREADRLAAAPTLRWPDFEAFALRVSHQIVLGAGEIEPDAAVRLDRLVRRANWAFLPEPRHDFAAFYAHVERHLDRHRAPHGGSAPAACLMHECAAQLATGAATPVTQVPRQIGFWFFVLKDAIELHVARTLALIAAHPDVQDRARREIHAAPGLTAEAVHGFGYLEACLGEQLRLWTAVPLLLRRVDRAFTLRGAIELRPEQQILIHAGFHHRDPGALGTLADRFAPDEVTDTHPSVYVFSRGLQSCAGQFLARFLLKAALAALLARHRFELVAPRVAPGRIAHSCDHFEIELRPSP